VCDGGGLSSRPFRMSGVCGHDCRLRFDDTLRAYVCRVIDADGLEYCMRLQRRALELDRACAIRGAFPDSGWQRWWLTLHPLCGDATKELSKLFDGLSDVSGANPVPGEFSGVDGVLSVWALLCMTLPLFVVSKSLLVTMHVVRVMFCPVVPPQVSVSMLFDLLKPSSPTLLSPRIPPST
jgi:hypothetical protein